MYMFKYILKRIGLMLLTFIIIFTMCFVLVKLLPNKPVEQFGKDMEFIMRRRELLGYDKPIMEQFVIYIFGRTEYSYYELDENGNKIQQSDISAEVTEWEKQPKFLKDEDGNYLDSEGNITTDSTKYVPVYKTDGAGNYIDADGNVTTDPTKYVQDTEYKLDKNGQRIPIYPKLWETEPKRDENGDIVYKKNENGEYVDSENKPTSDPSKYVEEKVYKLDEDGNKIPVFKTVETYEKSNLPANVEYTTRGVGGIIRGYFGVSEVLYLGRDVWGVFAEKIPYTVALNIYSILFSIPIGIALGIYAALKKNKWQDHVISTGVMIFVSVPSFIYAFLVQYLLYFKLGWFPATANATNGAWSWSFFYSIIPAILSMSFGTIAGFARYTRAELTEVLTSEFMLLARTKGLTKGQAVVRHALRNAMVVIFPMILGEFISVMSGSLIIEQLFSIPGVGKLYINSIQASPTPDYNFFMLLTGFYTLIGLLAGIVIDISYGIIDPRIRMGAR